MTRRKTTLFFTPKTLFENHLVTTEISKRRNPLVKDEIVGLDIAQNESVGPKLLLLMLHLPSILTESKKRSDREEEREKKGGN